MMSHTDILAMLQQTGLPVAYDHFAEGESPSPPFVVFLFPASDNFSADGSVFRKINTLHVELYTDRKQPDVEASLEAVFDLYDLFYEKSEVWIPEERLYEVMYRTSVLVDEPEPDETESEQSAPDNQG